MVDLTESTISVEYAPQLKDRVSDRKSVHIDQKDLVVLQHQIFGVVVSVDHVVVMMYFFHKRDQLFPCLRRKIVLQESCPGKNCLFHIRQLPRRDQGRVNDAEHFHILMDTPVQLIRFFYKDPGKRTRIEKFKH